MSNSPKRVLIIDRNPLLKKLCNEIYKELREKQELILKCASTTEDAIEILKSMKKDHLLIITPLYLSNKNKKSGQELKLFLKNASQWWEEIKKEKNLKKIKEIKKKYEDLKRVQDHLQHFLHDETLFSFGSKIDSLAAFFQQPQGNLEKKLVSMESILSRETLSGEKIYEEVGGYLIFRELFEKKLPSVVLLEENHYSFPTFLFMNIDIFNYYKHDPHAIDGKTNPLFLGKFENNELSIPVLTGKKDKETYVNLLQYDLEELIYEAPYH